MHFILRVRKPQLTPSLQEPSNKLKCSVGKELDNSESIEHTTTKSFIEDATYMQ